MGQRETDKRRITLELSEELLQAIDAAKAQLGFRSRGPAVEQLLREVLDTQEGDDDSTDLEAEPQGAEPSDHGDPDSRAIVLIQSDLVSLQDQDSFSPQTKENDGFGVPRVAGGAVPPQAFSCQDSCGSRPVRCSAA